jgi:HupE / UreJ protein
MVVTMALLCSLAMAHPMPNSIVNLSVHGHRIKGKAYMPFQELQNAWNTTTSIDVNGKEAIQYFKDHIKAHSFGHAWETTIESVNTHVGKDADVGTYKEAEVSFSLTPRKGTNVRNFDFAYDVIIHQVINHSALVYLSEDWNNGINESVAPLQLGLVEVDVVTNKVLPLQIVIPKGSQWLGFKSFILLGMSHIREGVDHLFFLITLLLPVCLIPNGNKWLKYGGAKYSFIRILKIVTAFTVGHSITLLCCTLIPNIIPSRAIEMVIALSILVSAIHAIRPVFYKKEIYIALGFGLIHGMAFSNTLSTMDMSQNQLILALLGFNIGIELMQTFIVLMALPLLLFISQFKLYSSIRKAAAGIAVIASGAWFVERWTEDTNGITSALAFLPNLASQHFIWLVAMSVASLLYIVIKRNNFLQEK